MLVVPLQIPGDSLGIIALVVLLIVIIVMSQAIEIVRPYEKRALIVFGEFRRMLDPGISVVPPFMSRTYAVDMRTQSLDVPRQEAITRDFRAMSAEAVVYIEVMDAKKTFLETEDYKLAVTNLAETTLRLVLGDMDLDDVLNRSQTINTRMRRDLDEATEEWGVRVVSVEVRDVNPSLEVQQAMEQ
jgi:regulator of protease activity HflC (stomatin/prohibitin superfamily)